MAIKKKAAKKAAKKVVVCRESSHILVNCQANDSVDIRCGGPRYLGYDFYVEKGHEKESTDLIKKTLKECGFPCIGTRISPNGFIAEKNLWSLKMIEKCIKNNEAGLTKQR